MVLIIPYLKIYSKLTVDNMTMKKIAFFTDSHLGQQILLTNNETNSEKITYLDEMNEHKENFKIILNDIVEKGISDVVFGGDIGSPESNQWFFETINEYELNFNIILGNHDSYAEVSKYYVPDFPIDNNELKYEQEDDYFKYIFLDTSSNSMSPGQLEWLKDHLKTEKKIILFCHHPILKINTQIENLGAALKGRDEIQQALLAIKNDIIIFCGHYHMEDIATEKNIQQFSTIACSYQIEKAFTTLKINEHIFGYRIISIHNDDLHTDLISLHN